MNFKVLMVYLLVFISIFGLILKHDGMHEVWAQAVAPTTANVTISGWLDDLKISCTPVSFSEGVTVLSDGDTYPKVEDCSSPDIIVDLDPSTNVAWNFYMNATDLDDGQGHTIPVGQMQVNTTCGGYRIATENPITLDYSLVSICAPPETGESPLDSGEYAYVEFFLTVPAGTYNNTYLADLWIFANGTAAENNRIWIGIGQINVTIDKTLDVSWTLSPISFGTLSPRIEPYNATDYLGFPSNITSGPKTNIYVDLYINGTDLVLEGNPTEFIAIGDYGNVTYSNATGGTIPGSSDPTDWPDGINKLPYILPASSTNGDFPNWHLIPNRTHVYNYWNMTVPPSPPLSEALLPGTYVANLTAKIVDAGFDPTP